LNEFTISPVSKYEYDALYRLIKSEGREQINMGMPTYSDLPHVALPDTNPNAMQNYTQTYEYDHLGNIKQMKSINNWTRNYYYGANNYLLGHESGQTAYTYDQHGNMLSITHLQSLNRQSAVAFLKSAS